MWNYKNVTGIQNRTAQLIKILGLAKIVFFARLVENPKDVTMTT